MTTLISSFVCPHCASVGQFQDQREIVWKLCVSKQHHRWRRNGRNSPLICRSFFSGLFGKKKKAEESTRSLDDDENHSYHHHVSLPFPVSILQETFLSGRELKCCYKASIDGFSALSFHKKCDFKGPCVVVAETETGLRFGAFNPEGYRSTDDYYDTFEAFLFYWPNNILGQVEDGGEESKEYNSIDPIVLKKVGGSGAALFDYARGGPQFGPDGLLIGPPLAPVMGGFSGPDTNSGVGTLTEGKSRLGLSYAKRPDGKDSIFGDDRCARIREVEVFCSPEIAKLY